MLYRRNTDDHSTHGLGKGLDEKSALILGIEGYKNEARFPDEPARHKLLDLIGDLYLSGVPIRHINVVAERSGHRTNVKAAAMLAQALAKPTAGPLSAVTAYRDARQECRKSLSPS